MESEYYALTNTIKEAIWIQLLLSLTKLLSPLPFPILCDNQSTCTIANTDIISSCTKHIDVRHHFIHQHLNDSSFTTVWILTSDMMANILTKPLSLLYFFAIAIPLAYLCPNLFHFHFSHFLFLLSFCLVFDTCP